MLDLFRRKIRFTGSVLFPGALPPRLENLRGLAAASVEVTPGPPSPDDHWSATLRHPVWGEAQAVCFRDPLLPSEELLGWDSRLSAAEKEGASRCGAVVGLSMNAAAGNLLRDRKNALRFLGAVRGDDGGLVGDHVSQRFWSRDGLDDELSHDADPDIDALFTIHAVSGDDERCDWLHSHGLGEIGAVDFDILHPSEWVASGGGFDLLRAIAFQSAEKKLRPGGEPLVLFHPGSPVRPLSAAEFDRDASPEHVSARGDRDPDHVKNRVVLCDPPPTGFFSRFRSKAPTPSRALATFDEDRALIFFSNAATELMSQRARATFGIFRAHAEEFAEFGVGVLAKIGYRVDDGDEDDREHLWFEVDGFASDGVDATLLNDPFNIERLSKGDRGRHPLEQLTDWAIFTPVGQINPRSLVAARKLRERAPEIREAMAKEND